MDVDELPPFTPAQQRLLEFLAAYYGVSTETVIARIVANELEILEETLGVYADAWHPPPPASPAKIFSFSKERPDGLAD